MNTVFVYRCFDADGDLIYVGCSSNVTRRLAAHRASRKLSSRWLVACMATHTVEGPFATREDALAAEASAIADEAPIFNTQERRVPMWRSRADVAKYLVERGHLVLARTTACTCWSETRQQIDAVDPWCHAHGSVVSA